MAVAVFLIDVRLRLLQNGLAILVAALTLYTTLHSFSHRNLPYHRSENLDIFDPEHWRTQGFERENIVAGLDLIPPDVPVSATNTIVPHLSMRDVVHMFPRVEEAEYAILLREVFVYPGNPEEHANKVKEMLDSGEWEQIFEQGKVLVLRRK